VNHVQATEVCLEVEELKVDDPALKLFTGPLDLDAVWYSVGDDPGVEFVESACESVQVRLLEFWDDVDVIGRHRRSM
jgi:hypothetical protein